MSLAPTEVVYTNNINAGTANASYTYAGDDNHFGSSDNEDFEINKRPITIKVDAQSKYCGQIDPALTYKITSGNLVGSDAFNGSLTRDPGESSGTSYAISQGTVALSTNYALTYVGANLTIDGISIDASASSAPVQKGYTASLSALITPTVSGVPVTFVVTNEQDVAVYTSDPSLTTSGIATTTVPADKILTVGVYKVVATAGSGCATSIAYFPVFDPTESFVTGGGWINSPAGALAADASAVGKANFGFVSKYKKGKILTTEVDGNTEFQFQAGDINFKSSSHEAGSLVISGAKATYRGTGTINGATGYKFMVVAIDGNWNNGTAPDKFRIKISTTSGGVVYDNQMGMDENNADATILGDNGTGGGSIVIHEVKVKTKSATIATAAPLTPVTEPTLNVYPNPFKDKLYFDLSWNKDANARLEVYDVRGAKIATVFNGPINANESYRLEYVPNHVVAGMLIYRLFIDGQVFNGKVVYNQQQ